ncbi:hypothetical protein GCM10010172_52980 [Paractinoplanes ferrugineus]|uniref:Uncharacterized protein n=1 Tax=Paractinoplanes ferrugineus TaxID=113564 RepID=A0A919MDL7_9ACTN|nr:hypothetical protein [Actinoplanes ferrugineus]GIE11883.1 hypothetical protein Afe05nite_37230 [Actinoplanes ferrugineus]
MPPERPPIDLDPPPAETVAEFGPVQAPPTGRRRQLADLGRGLTTDRRLVPLAALLGAVALLASLVSEWQVTTVDAAVFGSDGDFGDRPVPTDISELGALGAAFLVGVFPLVVAVVLTIFGPQAGRRWVRLAGLSVGGTLFGLLFALMVSIGGQSRVVPNLYSMSLDPGQMHIGYGRGLWCAAAGVFFAMLALYYSDRSGSWTWRRPATDGDEQVPVDEPFELTVGPAKPFTMLGNDHDTPSGSGRQGISG